MRKQAAYRKKKKQNMFSMALVSVAVVMIVVVVIVKGFELRDRLALYEEKGAALQEQIDEENQRAEELENFEKYTQTKQYLEDIAKDKLGLVYEGEILFKQED